MSVLLSLRQVRSMSSVGTSVLLHSHCLPTRPSLQLEKGKVVIQMLFWTLKYEAWRFYVTKKNILAVSTLISPVTKVAECTVLDTFLLTFTPTDEVKGNLHLFRESKGFYLNGLRLSSFWTTLWCHTDAKFDLWEMEQWKRSDQVYKIQTSLWLWKCNE